MDRPPNTDPPLPSQRAAALAEAINAREYVAQRRQAKRALKTFTPHEDANEIVKVLDTGDEETCKALLHRHFYVRGVYLAASHSNFA